MKKNGYIIPLTLVIISLSIGIITYLYVRGSTFVPYVNTLLKREQAKSLALGGIQIGLSQLAQRKEEVEQTASPTDTQQKKKEKSYEEQLISSILPHLNQWQTFQLTQEVDGIDAQIKLCIMSENGKIPINALWDFKEKKFKNLGSPQPSKNDKNKKDPKQHVQTENSAKPLLQDLFKRIEKRVQSGNLFQAFEKFLKKRQYKLNDVTELLTIKEFEVFKNVVWYEPREGKKEGSKKGLRSLYLTDLFSVHSTSIDPWYLSDSVMQILDIQPKEASKETVNQWVKNFKPTKNWSQEWNKQLKERFGKELQSLPKKIDSIFDSTHVPELFCIVAQATVDSVLQRVYALVQTGKQPSIVKLYWL